MEETPTTVDQSPPDQLVERIRRRRSQLRTAEEQLTSAAATPSSARLDLWWAKVSHATAELAARFHEHVDDTERDEGLFHEVETVAPRLSRHVEQLRADHAAISSSLRELAEATQPTTADEVVARREKILDVLSQLARHRFSGSDLLYEAYHVDIGEAD